MIMDAATVSLIVFGCIFGAALLGMLLRSTLPEHHLNTETQSTVHLAMGFVATMAALILGLLVAGANDSYEKESTGVTQMAAKIVYLDRLLANFGPAAQPLRESYRRSVEQITRRMWPAENDEGSELDPSGLQTEKFFAELQSLKTENDLQVALKDQATAAALALGEMRWLEYEQAETSASQPMLFALVFWVAVLFASFAMYAPRNGTVVAALMLAALSVAGAIFLILELQSPFGGYLQIPNTQFLDAIAHLGK